MAKHNEIGKIGEKIAQTFLMKHGFCIRAVNERFKYGEIDIIAEKDNNLHFIEVKSVEIRDLKDISRLYIQPEDNMTFWKKRKFKRAIEIYISNSPSINDTKIKIDLVCVYVNTETREGRVKFTENIEL